MTEDTVERWLPVVGYEGLYDVSDLGRVRSLPRWTVKGVRGGKILHGHRRGDGYRQIWLHQNGQGDPQLVHRLVLEAFVGPCPPGQEARHGPGGASDDRLVNLCWGTPMQNQWDRARDRTTNRGERQGRAKLTWIAVVEIRQQMPNCGDQHVLAQRFGVSARTIRDVTNYKTWRYSPSEW